jgi:DNA gyrase subunit A
MVKQLNILGTGQIIPTALHVEMEKSYLEYAMSVIVGRALPDVRDGLKPVHRRIIYAMYELGLTPDRPYRKCARVVGDVLGKYHPHGDQSVYDALVRMVQDFSSRYPLLGGHGNFGSVDDDPAAAMRYTETRLSSLGYEAMLSDISSAIVEFTSNFDNSQQEPVVLPAQLPMLILNGCSGIAVGMATNIPPHNLGEVTDGLIALIDNPELSDKQLWEIIPGPDFPTGGQITDTQGIKEAYRTGKGLIPVRGVVQVEQITGNKKRSREKTALIVTELPYQVNKAAWIEKLADLVNQGKIQGIADLRDESDRTGMRVVIELKKDFDPDAVLEQLYQHTPLQTNFGVIFLALVNKQPHQLSLRQLLQEFLKFREETLTRQYTDELEKKEQRLHLVEGLLVALRKIDSVIEILRSSPDGSTANLALQGQLSLSSQQADSILSMPMRRITGLEKQKLETEYQELSERIQQLEKLLGDRHELLKSLKRELRSLKRKFADPRRTRIVNQKNSLPNSNSPANSLPQSSNIPSKSLPKKETSKSPSPPDNSQLTITHNGYIYWENLPPNSKNNITVKKGEDYAIFKQNIGIQKHLIVVTARGTIYPIALADIREQNRKVLLPHLLPKSAQRDEEKIIYHFFNTEKQIICLTHKGKGKRILTDELANLSSRGLSIIKLKDDDFLQYVCLAESGEEIAIATTGGRVLRYNINDETVPVMGRSAQGNQLIRLRYEEQIVGCFPLKSQDCIVLITQQGYGKKMPLNLLRSTKVGEIGSTAMQFTNKSDNLGIMLPAQPETKVVITTSNHKKIVIDIDNLPLENKDSRGEKIGKLNQEETIVSAEIIQ